MEKVEVVVVGAGLAGLSAAIVLAEAGVEVIVVERGDYPGSKNITGGRLYLGPVRQYFPDLWEEALQLVPQGESPLERRVVKERLTMMAHQSAITVELHNEMPYPSYTVLGATFDRWFATQAEARGAFIIPGYKVDDVILEGGRVVGIVSAGDEIHANVVLAADGALSFIAEKAKLRERFDPKNFAVGVKEVIELPSKTIEERFGVKNGEGVAHLFFGSLTQGITGGGFLYTNRESLSLGLVIGVHNLMEKQPPKSPHELLEAFKSRPEIQPLIAGGHLAEYSAHAIPESGLRALPRLVTDGMVVAGDAAGLALNLGVTMRGMDFALASGAMAAHALLRALEQNDYSAASLAHYERLLQDSFVLQDHQTFQHMPDFLANPRLFEFYPTIASELMEHVMGVSDKPKQKLSSTVFRAVRQHLLRADVLKDLWGMRRI